MVWKLLGGVFASVVLMIAITVAITIVVGTRLSAPSSARTTSATAAAKAEREDPKLTKDREKFLQKLLDAGAFVRFQHRPSGVTEAWIGRPFYDLDIENKQKFVAVLMADAMAKNPSAFMVVLTDSKTGKRTGEFSPLGGLEMK